MRILEYAVIPKRTDGIMVSGYYLPTQERRKLEPWQRLTHAQIVDELADAQKGTKKGFVICPGCGRQLERPYMQLDHLRSRAERGENDISNRILLCGPCNRIKGADLTLMGLKKTNRKTEWMEKANEDRAQDAENRAHRRYKDLELGMRKPLSD